MLLIIIEYNGKLAKVPGYGYVFAD